MTSTRLGRRALLSAMALAATIATTGLSTGARAAELDIATINAMDQATFVETFGGIFEKSPWVAEEGWSARPFDSIDDLHGELYAVVVERPARGAGRRSSTSIRSSPARRRRPAP